MDRIKGRGGEKAKDLRRLTIVHEERRKKRTTWSKARWRFRSTDRQRASERATERQSDKGKNRPQPEVDDGLGVDCDHRAGHEAQGTRRNYNIRLPELDALGLP